MWNRMSSLAILEISRLNDNLNLGDLLKEPVGPGSVGQLVKFAGFTPSLNPRFPHYFFLSQGYGALFRIRIPEIIGIVLSLLAFYP